MACWTTILHLLRLELHGSTCSDDLQRCHQKRTFQCIVILHATRSAAMLNHSSVALTSECWTCILSPITVNTLVIQNLVISSFHRKYLYGVCSWSYVPKCTYNFAKIILRRFEAIVRLVWHQIGVKAIEIWQFIKKCTIYYFCKIAPIRGYRALN